MYERNGKIHSMKSIDYICICWILISHCLCFWGPLSAIMRVVHIKMTTPGTARAQPMKEFCPYNALFSESITVLQNAFLSKVFISYACINIPVPASRGIAGSAANPGLNAGWSLSSSGCNQWRQLKAMWYLLHRWLNPQFLIEEKNQNTLFFLFWF